MKLRPEDPDELELFGEQADAARDAQYALAVCHQMGLSVLDLNAIVELAITEGEPQEDAE